ncbi:MAG: hypothetical protein AAB730_02260 [Patescibacteria group bacterium]
MEKKGDRIELVLLRKWREVSWGEVIAATKVEAIAAVLIAAISVELILAGLLQLMPGDITTEAKPFSYRITIAEILGMLVPLAMYYFPARVVKKLWETGRAHLSGEGIMDSLHDYVGRFDMTTNRVSTEILWFFGFGTAFFIGCIGLSDIIDIDLVRWFCIPIDSRLFMSLFIEARMLDKLYTINADFLRHEKRWDVGEKTSFTQKRLNLSAVDSILGKVLQFAQERNVAPEEALRTRKEINKIYEEELAAEEKAEPIKIKT